jgi:inosose dehydratase
MLHPSRRDFLRAAGAGVAAATVLSRAGAAANPAASAGREPERLTLGLASYTLRKFTLDQTIAMTKRLGLATLALKDFHLAMDASDEDLVAAGRKVREAGLDLYGCGVVYMKTEAEVTRAFHYAKTAGMRTIIGAPDPSVLPQVDAKTKETGIRVAIHNHGPEDKTFPTPTSVIEKIRTFNPLIGLCVDVGHTRRAGEDPADVIRKYRERVLDIHIKDINSVEKDGTTIEMGRGVLDIPGILKALLKIRFGGVVSFEFEKDENDPLPGVAESIGYTRGILSVV